MKEQITRKRGIQRPISSWRRQLSIHSESGLVAENMKLSLQKWKIFQIYKVTNAREVLQLQEKLRGKYKHRSKESEYV
jgi:hypothetical protein